MKELLILQLEGILQSWGESSKWNKRSTAGFPTKSGIVGMIGCAMGLTRDDPRIGEIAEKITIGIRSDRRGMVLDDFQTVQGMPDLYTADGKKRSSNTIVTPREYLCDASFMIVIDTDKELSDQIAEAFRNPVWPVYLGRKNCVPSKPVIVEKTDKYASIIEALKCHPKGCRSDINNEYEIEVSKNDSGSYSRPDIPLGNREFRKRTVWHGMLKEVPYVSDKS